LINTGSLASISKDHGRTSELDATEEFLNFSGCCDWSGMDLCGLNLPVASEKFALGEDLSSDSGDASVSSTRSFSSPEHSPSLPPKTPLKSDTLYYNKSGNSPPIVVRSYNCPHAECGARLRSEKAFSKHSKTKHPEKPYQCGLPRCDKSFADERSRRRHWDTRRHRTSDTPVYTCHCSASQPRWDKFKEHLRCCPADQTVASTYICCCRKAFQDITELERHKLASHTDKPGRPRKRREIPGEENR